MKYKAITTRITVIPEGEPIFSEMSTHIEIKDEAAGAFVTVSQCHRDSDKGIVRIDPEEWTDIKLVINTLIEQCEVLNGETK